MGDSINGHRPAEALEMWSLSNIKYFFTPCDCFGLDLVGSWSLSTNIMCAWFALDKLIVYDLIK